GRGSAHNPFLASRASFSNTSSTVLAGHTSDTTSTSSPCSRGASFGGIVIRGSLAENPGARGAVPILPRGSRDDSRATHDEQWATQRPASFRDIETWRVLRSPDRFKVRPRIDRRDHHAHPTAHRVHVCGVSGLAVGRDSNG